MNLAAREPQRPPLVSRRAPQEIAELLDVWVASWRATYADIDFDARRDWFVDHLSTLESAGAVTLCLHAAPRGDIKGFVVIDPATGWLDQICVHPDQFGNGGADALIAAAREASPGGIRLDVNADNDRALRFYYREGFMRLCDGALSQSGRPTLVLEWKPS
ncbi:GNAT family N-acetyltransferase [Methylocystis heyeri]|uniref:GNAT family N-acetyltransferase n=1 Tax=Methylocystis heyeri TaxID=391905 RepID=A0A6B8KB05_9HYPH|nr:GNAT family N-acetyltransferase [Methylocystis heyeri]QGM45296.1 GNAT family N-acetyltransferase [Methylocystis heyeri]